VAQIVMFSGSAAPKPNPLFRRTTTVGSDEGCDVVLAGAGVKKLHAEIVLEGKVHEILPLDPDAEVLVNGRKVKKARLEAWDVLRLGSVTLVYAPDDMPFGDRGADEKAVHRQLEALAGFSRKLMDTRSLDKALATLLDETLTLTGASKGFVIFVEAGVPSVKVARNVDRKSLPTDEALFSESIVERALKDGQPQLVADASSNREFSGCTSVINLRLASVMCVPLKVGGETLGVLYLGTERLLDLFDEVKLKTLQVFASQAAMIVQHLMLVESLEEDNKHLKEEVKASRFGTLIGSCPAMLEVFNKVTRVAPTDVPVLVLGETGTGKELVARELHARSARDKGPFIAINCGAIPEALLESELFGHVRGAFTGAVASTIGKFHAASGGTLFLDEVGELPLQLQVKLLRVLQDSMVTRVGGNRPEKVNVRLITATNRELAGEIRANRFREDLFYRICVVSITLPPLRERGEDIGVLAQYFVKRFAAEFQSPVRGFTPEAMKALAGYRWSGNIRELENRVRKAVLFADGPQIKLDALELPEKEEEDLVPLAVARERFERDYVLNTLRRNQGNRTKTARDLGVEPRTIFRYLERERESGRGPDDL
jgi:transcriptional regulator with GAF, ATPase, and Fis domain